MVQLFLHLRQISLQLVTLLDCLLILVDHLVEVGVKLLFGHVLHQFKVDFFSLLHPIQIFAYCL